MNKNLLIFLVAGVIIFVSGLAPLVLVNVQSPTQSYTTTTIDGVQIAYDVTMKPGTAMNAPVAVLIHGFSGNRIMMRMIAFALAEKGFICASLDLRGHGSSEGFMGGMMGSLGNFSNDVNAVVSALHTEGIGDTSRLVLIGHSMGGGVVLSLGAQLPSAVAVIGVEPASSPDWVNTTSPKNLLLIISTGDSVINATTVKQTFYKSINTTGTVNTVYDIAGNKRELLVVEGPDHLSALYDTAIISQIVNWTTSYVLGTEQPLGISPTLISISVYVSITGGTIMVASVLSLLHERLWHEKKKLRAPTETNTKGLLTLGVMAILLAGILGSIIGVMLTFALGLVTPLFVSNFLAGIFLGNAIILAILARIELRRSNKGFSYFSFIKSSIVRPSIKVDSTLGIVGAIAFMALLAITMGGNTTLTLSTASIRLVSLPLYLLIFALILVFYESFFKGVARPLMADGVKRMVLSVLFELIVLLISFMVELVVITTLLSLVIPTLGIGHLILGLGIQVVLLVLVPLSIGVVSAEAFYGKTGGWLAQILIGALIFATLTVVFSPVMHMF